MSACWLSMAVVARRSVVPRRRSVARGVGDVAVEPDSGPVVASRMMTTTRTTMMMRMTTMPLMMTPMGRSSLLLGRSGA